MPTSSLVTVERIVPIARRGERAGAEGFLADHNFRLGVIESHNVDLTVFALLRLASAHNGAKGYAVKVDFSYRKGRLLRSQARLGVVYRAVFVDHGASSDVTVDPMAVLIIGTLSPLNPAKQVRRLPQNVVHTISTMAASIKA